MDNRAHQHAQENIDKQQNNSNSNNNNNDNETSPRSTAVRHTDHLRSNAQPNYYNPIRGWQALKRWLPALTSPVRCCCFDFFLHTKQGAPKQKGEVVFPRLTKSTHRSSTSCPLMSKSPSCGGKHPSLIPSSLIFPRIFRRKRPLCPVSDVRRYVSLRWNSRLASFFQKR